MEKEIQQEAEPQVVALPEDIIWEHIMPRLPVKPLTRFKSVSKTWLSKISTPQFAKSNFKSSPSSPLQFLIFSGNNRRGHQHPLFTSITFHEHGRIQHSTNLGFTHNNTPIHVVGCCNGLVCFFDQNCRFTICNPVTQQSTQIPAISTPNFDPITMISAGFGYLSSIDDYKIACLIGISDDYLHAEDIDVVSVYIFSLRTQQWKEYRLTSEVYGVSVVRADVPTLVDDTLYWFSVSVVFGINLVNGEFSTIPFSLIEFFKLAIPYEGTKLFRTNGRLSVCCYRQAWVLNEDGSSWTKLYDLNHEGLRLMCVCEMTGKWVVLNRGVVGLLDPSKSYTRQYQGGATFDGPIFSAWNLNINLLPPPVLE